MVVSELITMDPAKLTAGRLDLHPIWRIIGQFVRLSINNPQHHNVLSSLEPHLPQGCLNGTKIGAHPGLGRRHDFRDVIMEQSQMVSGDETKTGLRRANGTPTSGVMSVDIHPLTFCELVRRVMGATWTTMDGRSSVRHVRAVRHRFIGRRAEGYRDDEQEGRNEDRFGQGHERESPEVLTYRARSAATEPNSATRRSLATLVSAAAKPTQGQSHGHALNDCEPR
jgi:hypothetical protein